MQAGAVVRTFVLALPTNVPAFASRLVIALFDNCVVKCRVENAARTKLSASFNTSLRFMRIASYLHGSEEGWRGQHNHPRTARVNVSRQILQQIMKRTLALTSDFSFNSLKGLDFT